MLSCRSRAKHGTIGVSVIHTIRLQQFRSYHDASFEFEPGVNIIVGPNASGKTNLLEAILVSAKGGSYRVSDIDLVSYQADWARLDALYNDETRTVKLQQTDDRIKKTYVVGGKQIYRLTRPYVVPVVLFEPNHLQLLTQSPELRRAYIDDVLEQIHPTFFQLRRDYKRTLSQRNRLLKQQAPPPDFFVWNVRLSELGGQIAMCRQQFIESHTQPLQRLYGRLAETSHHVSLLYRSNIPLETYSSALLQKLEQSLHKDMERGFTTAGPHRDDLVITIDNHPLAQAASRGETRTVLLALKLLEVEAIERIHHTKPILLLDDVFSELDGARRRKLTEYLTTHQTFITTTDADIVIQHFSNKANVVAIQ